MSDQDSARAAQTRVYRVQLVASVIAAALIVVVVVALVTAKIGPGPDSQELRDREDRREELLEEREELLEERRDRQEERLEERSQGSGGSPRITAR